MMETAIITGGSKGIGLAAAKRFLDRGARVITISRSPCPLDGVQSVLRDLTAPGAAEAIAAELMEIVKEPARVAIVHCAALHRGDSAATVMPEDLRAVLEVALVLPTVLNRALLPRMQPGSSILYVGSTLSEKAVAGVLSYVVSKHGVVGLMRATCQDLLGTGVHTICVCPGFTDTEMLREHIGDDPAAKSRVLAMTGYNRLIEPGEIASVLAFAADSPVLNGAVIHANLGQRES